MERIAPAIKRAADAYARKFRRDKKKARFSTGPADPRSLRATVSPTPT